MREAPRVGVTVTVAVAVRVAVAETVGVVVDVGVAMGVDMRDRINDGLGHLRAGGTIEVYNGPAIYFSF